MRKNVMVVDDDQDAVLAARASVLCVTDGGDDGRELGTQVFADVDLDRILELRCGGSSILVTDGVGGVVGERRTRQREEQ